MDGLLRPHLAGSDRQRPQVRVPLRVREDIRLSVNRVTGHSLRRWWQPRYWIECGDAFDPVAGSPLELSDLFG
jgi:hypothetical protein